MELSKSELRATRNSLIIEIMSNSECGLQEISRIFNLSEGYLKNYILKDIKPFQVKVEHSLEQLKEYRANIMTDLKQQRFTEKEILYIFNCKSSNEDLRSLYLRTFEEHEILADKYETLSLAYKSLEDKNKNLELKNQQLSESVKASIKLQKSLEEIKIENSDLKEKLLESQQANEKSEEENSHLNQEIENLQRFKESASKYYIEQSEKESEQQLRIHILESDLQEAYKENNKLKSVNKNLVSENSELQSLSSSIIYLQADLTAKDNKIQSLEDDIQRLKTEIENLTAPSEETEHEKINSKFERVYTIAQRQQMIDIYYKNHCKRKQSLEAVRAELKINICDRHFVRILEDEGVFKSTYKKRKSIKPKK